MLWLVQELSGVLQWQSVECERWRSLDCERLSVFDAYSEATWRDSPSIRSRIPAVLSDVEGKMLAVVGRGVTLQILSSRWEAESKLPSV
jgi:hypothetical protein